MKFATALTDIVAAPLFRTEADGRRVFAPSAMSSKRYLIPDEAAEARLRGRMATLMIVSALISGVIICSAVWFFGSAQAWSGKVWLGVAAAFGLQILINTQIGQGLASDLPLTTSGEPVGVLQTMVAQAIAWPRWLCWLELIVGPLVFVGGIMGIAGATTTYDLVLGIFAIPLSALMLAYGLIGLLGRK